ncbi:MAG: glutathione synthase, partial [Methylophilaceae bacterium]|nr:glutathione synthase [Methylophilaceae bacterium]
GDKRILLLNGNPLPYGLMRKPNKNEVRANLAKGGQASLAKLSKSDYNIIETIKPFLVKNELSFVGIDVIGDYLTEINVTSPTGLVEIANLSNIDISKIVFDELS